MNVTEYRTHEVVCPDCKVVHKTEFPATVSQPAQYGENLQALMLYLSNYLLGYRNIENKFVPGMINEAAYEAMKNIDKPYYLCIDEMNLAREKY